MPVVKDWAVSVLPIRLKLLSGSHPPAPGMEPIEIKPAPDDGYGRTGSRILLVTVLNTSAMFARLVGHKKTGHHLVSFNLILISYGMFRHDSS